jgi:hypothetical protein
MNAGHLTKNCSQSSTRDTCDASDESGTVFDKRSKHMSSNYYLMEKLAEARRLELLREAEQQRLLNSLPQNRYRPARYLAAKIGMLLVALGSRLQQIEASRTPAMDV